MNKEFIILEDEIDTSKNFWLITSHKEKVEHFISFFERTNFDVSNVKTASLIMANLISDENEEITKASLPISLIPVAYEEHLTPTDIPLKSDEFMGEYNKLSNLEYQINLYQPYYQTHEDSYRNKTIIQDYKKDYIVFLNKRNEITKEYDKYNSYPINIIGYKLNLLIHNQEFINYLYEVKYKYYDYYGYVKLKDTILYENIVKYIDKFVDSYSLCCYDKSIYNVVRQKNFKEDIKKIYDHFLGYLLYLPDIQHISLVDKILINKKIRNNNLIKEIKPLNEYRKHDIVNDFKDIIINTLKRKNNITSKLNIISNHLFNRNFLETDNIPELLTKYDKLIEINKKYLLDYKTCPHFAVRNDFDTAPNENVKNKIFIKLISEYYMSIKSNQIICKLCKNEYLCEHYLLEYQKSNPSILKNILPSYKYISKKVSSTTLLDSFYVSVTLANDGEGHLIITKCKACNETISSENEQARLYSESGALITGLIYKDVRYKNIEQIFNKFLSTGFIFINDISILPHYIERCILQEGDDIDIVSGFIVYAIVTSKININYKTNNMLFVKCEENILSKLTNKNLDKKHVDKVFLKFIVCINIDLFPDKASKGSLALIESIYSKFNKEDMVTADNKTKFIIELTDNKITVDNDAFCGYSIRRLFNFKTPQNDSKKRLCKFIKTLELTTEPINGKKWDFGDDLFKDNIIKKKLNRKNKEYQNFVEHKAFLFKNRITKVAIPKDKNYNYIIYCDKNNNDRHNFIGSKCTYCNRTLIDTYNYAMDKDSTDLPKSIKEILNKKKLIEYHYDACSNNESHNLYYSICLNCGLTYNEIEFPSNEIIKLYEKNSQKIINNKFNIIKPVDQIPKKVNKKIQINESIYKSFVDKLYLTMNLFKVKNKDFLNIKDISKDTFLKEMTKIGLLNKRKIEKNDISGFTLLSTQYIKSTIMIFMQYYYIIKNKPKIKSYPFLLKYYTFKNSFNTDIDISFIHLSEVYGEVFNMFISFIIDEIKKNDDGFCIFVYEFFVNQINITRSMDFTDKDILDQKLIDEGKNLKRILHQFNLTQEEKNLLGLKNIDKEERNILLDELIKKKEDKLNFLESGFYEDKSDTYNDDENIQEVEDYENKNNDSDPFDREE